MSKSLAFLFFAAVAGVVIGLCFLTFVSIGQKSTIVETDFPGVRCFTNTAVSVLSCVAR